VRQWISALTRMTVCGSCVLVLACAPPAADEPATAPPAAPPPSATASPPAAATPFNPVMTVLELMQAIVVPAAETYWSSVQVTVDADGEHEFYPENDAEWTAVRHAALAIAESGNLLMLEPRAVDKGPWQLFSRELIDAGVAAAAAAEAQDVDAVFAAGEEVYNVCSACHMRYTPGLQRVLSSDDPLPLRNQP
jgi:mono/diheme cytochrome c family protein